VRHWLDLGIDFQHVGINVTTGDFQRGDLEQRIVQTFESAGVPLRHVILEVNEAVFMGGSDQLVPRAVRALRQRGLLVALDDFGTGFASLTHLLSFPVDVIKIDKSFIDRMGSDGPSDVVIGSIIDIAHKLNMKLVAEGIETREQAEALRALGCNLGQGYLFSRPCSVEDTTRLLELFAQRRNNAPAARQAS
jgi:EAL domain-containing protein (putative c-di-GMP-specific phosphodiesterase class I)